LKGRAIIFSDVHGNYLAFKKSIENTLLRKPDVWISLGDTIGYFPDGNEVLNSMREMNCYCVRGNHEQMLLHGEYSGKDSQYQLSRQQACLSSENLEWISSWSECIELLLPNGAKALLLHGSPADPINGYLYHDTAISDNSVNGYDFLFCGHTHRPFIRMVGGTSVYNVGSIGLPRDGTSNSTCVQFDTGDVKCEFIHYKMDLQAMRDKYTGQVHPAQLGKIGVQ